MMESAGVAWASFPGDPPHKAFDDAEELAKERGLEDEARRRLEAAIEEQAALLAQLAAIRQLLRDMEALDRLEQEFGESPAKYKEASAKAGSGLGGLAGRARSVSRRRPDLPSKTPPSRSSGRPAPTSPTRSARRWGLRGIASPLLRLNWSLNTAMGGAGYMEEAGAWQPDAADFTNACRRDAVEGDLVYFSVGADSLPGGDGEEREVRVIAELVTRSAKMSELHDPCTLETLWRSDGGPGGQITVPLGTLTGDGCTRAVRAPGGRRRGGAELGGRRAGMGTRGGAAGAVRGDPPGAPREQEHEDVTGGLWWRSG